MKRVLALVALLLAACAAASRIEAPAVPSPPPADPSAAVTRRPLPDAPTAPSADRPVMQGDAPRGAAPLAVSPDVSVPPGYLYVCVTERAGSRLKVGIEFMAKVQQLCERHPEMGPCQYERNACRHGGGRVFDAAGHEITVATEAEYDRKVMRIRLRSN